MKCIFFTLRQDLTENNCKYIFTITLSYTCFENVIKPWHIDYFQNKVTDCNFKQLNYLNNIILWT